MFRAGFYRLPRRVASTGPKAGNNLYLDRSAFPAQACGVAEHITRNMYLPISLQIRPPSFLQPDTTLKNNITKGEVTQVNTSNLNLGTFVMEVNHTIIITANLTEFSEGLGSVCKIEGA